MRFTKSCINNSLPAASAALIIMLSVSAAWAGGPNLIQATDYGDINWSQETLTGQGPNLETAQQNLWKIIAGLRLNSRQRVGELISRSGHLKTQLQQLILKAKTIESPDLAGGQSAVKLRFSLTGAFVEALLAVQPINNVSRPPKIFGRPAGNPGPNGPMFMREITGLVLDARGFRVMPAINPQILSRDGRLIYGPGSVSRSYMVKRGLATYMPDMALAEAAKRAADNPIVIKVLDVDADTNTDLIISNQDADRINRAAKRHDFLYKCRVIIVIDQPGISAKD